MRAICAVASCVLGAITLAAASAAQGAVSIGQVDTFQDLTVQGWTSGPAGGPDPNPNPPANIATGGPGGSGDAYLRIIGTGNGGPGGRLAAINRAQWGGNYITAGVDRIFIDLRNEGATDLQIRLFFADAFNAPANSAISSTGFVIPANSGWVTAQLPIDPGSLTSVVGDVATTLANAVEMRIVHADFPFHPPAPMLGTLGVDNIRALPEPSTAIVGAAVAGLSLRRRRLQNR